MISDNLRAKIKYIFPLQIIPVQLIVLLMSIIVFQVNLVMCVHSNVHAHVRLVHNLVCGNAHGKQHT